jgi:NUBPL iron-transfer P-loop NTPase
LLSLTTHAHSLSPCECAFLSVSPSYIHTHTHTHTHTRAYTYTYIYILTYTHSLPPLHYHHHHKQRVALTDVRKEISFCRKLHVPILGLVENMSGYTCPHCAECTNIFSTGGGESLCTLKHLPFIGRLPIDPRLSSAMESGVSVFQRYPDCTSLQPLVDFAARLTSSQSPAATPASECSSETEAESAKSV